MAKHMTQHGLIHTSHDYPPIPMRQFDWSAHHDNYDGPGSYVYGAVGYGKTEQEAIADLLEQLDAEDERDDMANWRPQDEAAV